MTIRFAIAFVAAVIVTTASGQLPAQQSAPQPGEQVIANVTLKSPSNKENPIFAEIGELMTITKQEKGRLLVQTTGGRNGYVRPVDVTPIKDAKPILDKLIKETPQDPWNYSTRALVWHFKEDKQQEIADLSMAIRLGIKSPSVLINRGVAYATTGEMDKAIADYDKAIEQGFDNHSVYMNRAVAYLSKGESKQAAEDFTRVIDAQPDSLFAYLQRGMAWQQEQLWDQAIADFTKVLELDPKHTQALSSRGFTHFLAGQPAKAVEDFTGVIKLNPKSALAYNNRGYNRQMIGQFAEAVADFDKAAELEPKYALAYQNKAWLLATCPDDKIRDGKTAVAAATKAGELREWKAITDIKSLAAAYAEVGDFDKAVQWQQKAVDMAEGEAKSGEQELLKLFQAKAPFRFAPPAPKE